MSIDSALGEVRLSTEELIAIPERLQFTVVATDVAGNSSSLDVVVDLTVETSAPDDPSDEGASALGDGVQVSMSSFDVPSTDDFNSTEGDGAPTNVDLDGPDIKVTSIYEDVEQSQTDPVNEDLLPPEINPDSELTSALRLDASSDSGSSDRDAVTQLRIPRFSGQATPDSRIELFDGRRFHCRVDVPWCHLRRCRW